MSDTRTPDHAALLRRSLLAIDQLEAKLAAVERARSEPIAIIGMGCRFAGGARDGGVVLETARCRHGRDERGAARSAGTPTLYFDPNPEAPGKAYTQLGLFRGRASTSSMRSSSASRRARRRASIRSSACCSK